MRVYYYNYVINGSNGEKKAVGKLTVKIDKNNWIIIKKNKKIEK